MHGEPNILENIPIIGNELKKKSIEHLNHHKEVQINMEIKGEKDGLNFGWKLFFILLIITNFLFITKNFCF